MPSWRRLLSAILFLAFAAGSILTSTSFVWCVGGDGHLAMERSTFIPGKHIDRHPVADLTGHQSPDATDPECRDWSLLDAFNASSADAGKGCLPFALRHVVLLTWLYPPQRHSLPFDLNGTGRKRIPPDLYRISRRSIVLLI